MIRFFVEPRSLQGVEGGSGILLPQLFELVDLSGRDLTSSRLLLVGGNLDKPVEEAPVLDQWLPLGRIPEQNRNKN